MLVTAGAATLTPMTSAAVNVRSLWLMSCIHLAQTLGHGGCEHPNAPLPSLLNADEYLYLRFEVQTNRYARWARRDMIVTYSIRATWQAQPVYDCTEMQQTLKLFVVANITSVNVDNFSQLWRRTTALARANYKIIVIIITKKKENLFVI